MKPTSQLLIMCLVALLLVLYAATVYLTISTDYHLTLTGAERQVVALSGLLEQHASRTMGEAESLLDSTTHYLLERDRNETDFEVGIFMQRAETILRKSPQIRAVFLVDPKGMMIANSERSPFTPFNVADREYYRYHAGNEDQASHIGTPVQSRLTGSWLFTITRRVDRPDGSLKMIAGLAIDPGYFTRFYRGLDLVGGKGEVHLARSDGTILASFPAAAQESPRTLKDSELYRAYERESRHGSLEGETYGSRKLSAFQKSEHYPLVSFISLDRGEILAPWRSRAFRHGIGALASTLLIFMLTFALVRRLRRLAGANDTLHAQKLELELAAQVFEQSQQSIVITDRDGVILRVNRYFTELSGFTPEEAIGRTPRILRSQRHDNAFYQELWKSLHEEGKWRGEIWNRKKNSDGFAALLTISSVRDAGGTIIYYIGVIEDITEQKLSSERIYHLAHFDVLTNLPNRRLFNDRLLLAIQQAERYGSAFAVMFLDLDNFKRVNDTLGHHAGDLLLQEVAQRLLGSLRKVDAVARFGGDEFAVMLEEVKDPADVKRVAQKIIEAVSAPILLEGVEVYVGVSIGVSIYPADGSSVEDIFRNSDTAMYQAKALGKNRCQFFDAEMTAQVTRRLVTENELRRAIPGELFLRYQPQADLASGEIVAAEALVRWQHPERGELAPHEFLQVAEESGQSGQLWSWVLETACRQAADWQGEKGIRLRVTVNIPAVQLFEPSFPAALGSLLRETGIDPGLLELEIAEASVMCKVPESVGALGRLRELGVRLTLDNFGSGCASLLGLKKLPLDRIKIDRTVIGDIELRGEELDVLRMIIAVAHSLHLQVAAVGVENREQREVLRAEGCDGFQGYLLARPLRPEELEALVLSVR